VLIRSFSLGVVGWDCLKAAIYLTLMGTIGLMVAGRRLGTLLRK